jgi:hypothetical protein
VCLEKALGLLRYHKGSGFSLAAPTNSATHQQEQGMCQSGAAIVRGARHVQQQPAPVCVRGGQLPERGACTGWNGLVERLAMSSEVEPQ